MCEKCNKSLRSGPSRRALFGAFAAGLVATSMPAHFVRAAEATKPTISPDEALTRLMAGHANYLANKASLHDYASKREALSKGQWPIAAILSCADSRVGPELVFDQGPGDLFVLRVAGNIENADGLASLEYGVKFLGIPLIMVLGHSGCGAVDAAIKVHRDNVVLPGHLPGLIQAIIPAVKTAEASNPTDLLAASITGNVRRIIADISDNQPVLGPMIQHGDVKIVGGVFDLPTGKVALV
jgi:carbonic anhydrase